MNKSKGNTLSLSKGFTIIELIVVIAIIAVLAAIVLVNVTQYVAKGKNSAIKGDMSTIMTNAAIFYDQNSSTYTGFSATTNYTNPAAGVTSNGGTISNAIKADGSAFCACSTMNITNSEPTGTTYCVDTNGNKQQTTTACATECAAATALCL